VKIEFDQEEVLGGSMLIGVCILLYLITFMWVPSCSREEQAERDHEIQMKSKETPDR